MSKSISVLLIVLSFVSSANASVFSINGKEVSKGDAIRALMSNPKTVVIKQDQVVLNTETMTLKNKPKNKPKTK